MKINTKSLGIALIACAPLMAVAQQPEQAPAPAAQDPVTEYETLLRDIRGLETYNALLTRQIAQQETKISDIQTAIGGVPQLEVQIPPLLIRMVDGLREFIELDMPFLEEERQDRVATLYSMIEDPDPNNAVKLRRILEIWLIEVEYGSAFRPFEGTLPGSTAERDADFVLMGRSGLYYQTRDEEALTGAWDSRTETWVELGSEYRNPVRQAIRMARNQIAPELVLLPTVPPLTE